ncbi:TPA: hypothetical protein L3715_004743 [Pseudomonas aeruginosa]|nr:hypothetical protein [Pseudomonas aeruginosa]
MKDKAHPFPFDAQAELVMKMFMKATGERLDQARRQVGGGNEVQHFSHEGHGPLREWTLEAGLSNQWLARLMNISDMAFGLT